MPDLKWKQLEYTHLTRLGIDTKGFPIFYRLESADAEKADE